MEHTHHRRHRWHLHRRRRRGQLRLTVPQQGTHRSAAHLHQHPARDLAAACRAAGALHDGDAQGSGRLRLSTTRATNAILEGDDWHAPLLTTAGFPDVLVLREGGRSGAFDYRTTSHITSRGG
ncbi:hypothetical protein HBB16_17615 [Pseudonocardia sp. MCCB 268]|nr:hypothetical protein [Pseudonocardia cytotoxica]